MTGYFVTGTDTTVGKTHVTCLLARQARARGHKVFAFKPIETGCAESATGTRTGADQELLAVAAGDWQQGRLRGVYRFALPAAPRVAAEAEGAAVDLGLVAEVAREGSSHATFVLIEGAGGWRVPITATADMSDLARATAPSVLVVARSGLGTINHTLLTIEAIQRDGLAVAGVVLSRRPDEERSVAESNRRELARRWSGRLILLQADPTALDELISI